MVQMGVNQKIGGKTTKKDGENNGSKPYEQMDDLGGKKSYFWVNTQMVDRYGDFFFRLQAFRMSYGPAEKVVISDDVT